MYRGDLPRRVGTAAFRNRQVRASVAAHVLSGWALSVLRHGVDIAVDRLERNGVWSDSVHLPLPALLPLYEYWFTNARADGFRCLD